MSTLYHMYGTPPGAKTYLYVNHLFQDFLSMVGQNGHQGMEGFLTEYDGIWIQDPKAGELFGGKSWT